MFATTRSIFYFYNGIFDSNYGDYDSTISAMKTSSSYPFIIKSSLFSNNKANSNTMSLK